MKYYELLDIPPTATPEAIKAAYRIQVQLHHPDRLQQASPQVRTYAEEKIKRINEAYTVLSDPVRRAAYDNRQTHARRRDDDDDDLMNNTGRKKKSRTSANQRAEAEASAQWWRDQQQREAEAKEAERAEARRQRTQQQADQERRAEEERNQRASTERYPRVRQNGNGLILTFKPGVWTTLKRVPDGEFIMGSNPARDPLAQAHEQPQHRLHLPEFYLGQYPLTNAQYQVFATATRLEWAMPTHQAEYPVVNLMWEDAVVFCRWLSKNTGQPFRLPTEAEWEKAARGTDGRLYPWGDEWEATRLNSVDGFGGPSPVGQFSPAGDSVYGLADMSGNVWEWCADWYNTKEYARRAMWTAYNPHGPESGDGYVVRGGAFDSSAKHTRCAHRNWQYGFKRLRNVGLRLALTWNE